MKTIKLIALLFLTSLLAVSCSENEVLTPDVSSALENSKDVLMARSTGNGALSGAHYNLNIIGMGKGKKADMTGSNGHVIFVGLGTKKAEEFVTTRIYLYDSEESTDSDADYRVLDANGTDGEASFELPKPGYDAYVVGDPGDKDTFSDYSILVRPLGKPGGWSTITTCADLADQDALYDLLDKEGTKVIQNEIDGGTGAYCSVEQVGAEVTMRKKGKSTFVNVTAELTSIVLKIWVDLDDSGTEDVGEIFFVRVPIFDDMIENEYWKYDNNGLRLLQVRFYPVGTEITDSDITTGW